MSWALPQSLGKKYAFGGIQGAGAESFVFPTNASLYNSLIWLLQAHEYVAHSSEVTCLDIGPHSGAVVATGGADKRVNVWKVGRASSIWSLAGNSSAIEAVCFGPIEEHLASGSSGGAVKLYDLHVGRVCGILAQMFGSCSFSVSEILLAAMQKFQGTYE
jgi:WD40 repeat protein